MVRAHETRRDQAAAVVADVTMPVLRLAGIFLLASFAVLIIALVLVAFRGPDVSTAHGGDPDRPSAALDWWPDTGPAGLVVLGGYYLVRRFARRSGGRRPPAAWKAPAQKSVSPLAALQPCLDVGVRGRTLAIRAAC